MFEGINWLAALAADHMALGLSIAGETLGAWRS